MLDLSAHRSTALTTRPRKAAPASRHRAGGGDARSRRSIPSPRCAAGSRARSNARA